MGRPSCLDSRAALATLALLFLVVLALLLSRCLLFSLLLLRLPGLTLFSFARFPFHDSQVPLGMLFSPKSAENYLKVA